LIDSRLANAIFPHLSARQTNLGIQVLSQLRKKVDFALALAAFFASCPMDFALEKIKLLKLSRNTTKHIKFLLDKRAVLLNDKMSLAQLKLLLSGPYFWDLFELQRAIQKAANKSIRSLSKLKRRINELGDVELKPKPLLNGYDLMKLGAVAGPVLGQLAEEMYIAQLEGGLRSADQARTWAKNWLEKHKQITEA